MFNLEIDLVYVLDKNGKALMPCTEKRARQLLARGRARVHRVAPFVIRLVDRNLEQSDLQPLRLKLDPGSKTTGIAIVREAIDRIVVVSLTELVHRGREISEALTQRASFRRRRRGALRYRAPRFDNRPKTQGWLAPSLQHRVDTTMAWVKRLQKWAPISAISSELVRFDMQKMENPEISGIEYQQGTLLGYEVREYLLEKWGRKCMYCDKQDEPLQIEHIDARANGGSNRISNLGLACECCNVKKGKIDVRVFVKDSVRLAKILARAKVWLRDAAAVNATRSALVHKLSSIGLPVETGSGGLTKFNRSRLVIPKTHALDAVCVGEVNAVENWRRPTLTIKAAGRGAYKRTRLDQYGFPRGYLMREKSVFGFQTGDHVRAVVPNGKKAGIHIGRVAIRASGNFNIKTSTGMVQGIAHRHCTTIQRSDGYGYLSKPFLQPKAGESDAARPAPYLPALKDGVSRSKI